jgi:hypothetical protein
MHALGIPPYSGAAPFLLTQDASPCDTRTLPAAARRASLHKLSNSSGSHALLRFAALGVQAKREGADSAAPVPDKRRSAAVMVHLSSPSSPSGSAPCAPKVSQHAGGMGRLAR